MTAEQFIARWQHASGSELANAQSFVRELAALLDQPPPNPAREDTRDNDYVFERRVIFRHGDGKTSEGRIDCYKRGHFVLEAKKLKQSAQTKGFDDAMLCAQAEGYARALPAEEGRPPFIVTVDVGNVLEIYAEFTRSGATYTPFPDPRSHRIKLADLADDAIRARLRAIWTDPQSLDPSRATRQIAEKLAGVAKALESAGRSGNYSTERVAGFLTRCLFSMFAEDVGLLPRRAFTDLLDSFLLPSPSGRGAGGEGAAGQFVPLVGALWKEMDEGGFSVVLRHTLPRFNGKLFKTPDVLPLDRDQIGLLLERALDPACGSANFLYITLEHMKRLEGEILDFAHSIGQTLGGSQQRLGAEGLTVDPHQFLGLELNPRAAAIAELVLWIGYLQWHFRTRSTGLPPSPILRDFRNIECRAAVLAHHGSAPVCDHNGIPQSRWDGKTTKAHAITGEKVPDESARQPLLRYHNPRRAEWPAADYIVGNPPFIGAATLRAALGDGYVEALWSTWSEVPESADYVMYWWQHAAALVNAGAVQRFGFITTNSLKQTFNRRLVQQALDGGLHLAFAIPDHPWVDSADGAAVRIAMTVGTSSSPFKGEAGRGIGEGRLLTVTSEREAGGEGLEVTLDARSGKLHADLRIGANVAVAATLRANCGISSPGFKLHGAGFIVTSEEAAKLEADAPIKDYRNGRDLTDRPRGVKIIDLFGLTASDVRSRYPATYQWV